MGRSATPSSGAVNAVLATGVDRNLYGQAGARNAALAMGVDRNLLGDPYFGFVTCLLNFDDVADGSTSIVDITGKSWTAASSSAVDTAIIKYGTGSLRGPQANARIHTADHADFDFGTNDWTIEFWLYFDGSDNFTSGIYCFLKDTTYGFMPIGIAKAALTEDITFRMSTDGSTLNIANDLVIGNTTHGVWHHIALVRDGATIRSFLDGVAGATANIGATALPGWTGSLSLGLIQSGTTSAVHMDDIRITNGVARYTSAFTPPGKHPISGEGTWGGSTGEANSGSGDLGSDRGIIGGEERQGVTIADALSQYVIALLHFDGSDGSTTITDEVGEHTWTAEGGAQIDTARSKYGGASALFDGNADVYAYLGTDANFGTDDFCIEGWIYPTGASGTIVGNDEVLGAAELGKYHVTWLSGNGGQVKFQTSDGGSFSLTSAASSAPLNTWTHWALAREGDVMRLFVNGVGVEAAFSAEFSGGGSEPSDHDDDPLTAPQNTDGIFLIGFVGALTNGFTGSQDDIRITKGHARYTENFTPPIAAFEYP